MPMLFWLPMIVFYGMCQAIEEEVCLHAAAVHAQGH